MSTAKIFTTNPLEFKSFSFYPRNYDPVYLFVEKFLRDYGQIEDMLVSPVKGGSTPPAYFFYPKYEEGIPFVKTSAILRHVININDLHNINKDFHKSTIKRSITKPYDVIFSMTGKFMGKAAICPPTIEEMNMSQNSVVFRTKTPLASAFLTIFLNSQLNQVQIKGNYSITKQKYLNQGKIAKLNILPEQKQYNGVCEDYINGIDRYYNSLSIIQKIIQGFNDEYININKDFLDEKFYFSTKPERINNKILLPSNYRKDFLDCSDNFLSKFKNKYLLEKERITKGNEIGSKNYLFEGVPFIKTSDISNYDVDYEPNYYCSEAQFNEISQDIKTGDIVFTKDGKRGEVAIIQENANIVISGGLIKYRPLNANEMYWLFLLLSSNLGKIYFDKWFVIASTMAHLRKDFFNDFYVPEINLKIENKYLIPLKESFCEKMYGYEMMMNAKEKLLSRMYDEYGIKH